MHAQPPMSGPAPKPCWGSAVAPALVSEGPRPGTRLTEGAEDRFGSKTVLTAPKRHFRVTPRNGHRQNGPVGPVRANKRHADPILARAIYTVDPCSCSRRKTPRAHAPYPRFFSRPSWDVVENGHSDLPSIGRSPPLRYLSICNCCCGC